MKKSLFFDPAQRLPLACFEASRAWFSGELDCVKAVQKPSPLKSEAFEVFLKTWGLARTARITGRDELRSKLAEITENYQSPDDIDPPRLARDVEGIFQDQLTTGRPYSLVSKYLFCKNPLKFSPYDKFARKGLNMHSAQIGAEDYVAFQKAFERFHKTTIHDLEERGLTWDRFTFGCDKFENETLFSRRVADKHLMLLGCFGDYRMAGYVNKHACQFQPDLVAQFS